MTTMLAATHFHVDQHFFGKLVVVDDVMNLDLTFVCIFEVRNVLQNRR